MTDDEILFDFFSMRGENEAAEETKEAPIPTPEVVKPEFRETTGPDGTTIRISEMAFEADHTEFQNWLKETFSADR